MNYEQPQKYWEERDAHNKNMPREELLETIKKFLKAHYAEDFRSWEQRT